MKKIRKRSRLQGLVLGSRLGSKVKVGVSKVMVSKFWCRILKKKFFKSVSVSVSVGVF